MAAFTLRVETDGGEPAPREAAERLLAPWAAACGLRLGRKGDAFVLSPGRGVDEAFWSALRGLRQRCDALCLRVEGEAEQEAGT